MAQAQVERKNPSQDKSRAYNNLKKSTTNIVEVAKSPALIFFHNPSTKKLEVWGDMFSVETAKNDPDLLVKADTILSHSVASGQDFAFTDLKDLQISQQEKSVSACPLPRLQFKMFSEYKKFKENSHLRSSYAKMWRSLAYGTKEMRYGVAGCKPEWFDEEKFVSWSKFKGSARPEGFTGNWAFLQYDIMKACYMHYMTPDEIEEYLVRNLSDKECGETLPSFDKPTSTNQTIFSVPVVMDNGDTFVEVAAMDDEVFEAVNPFGSLENETEENVTIEEPKTPEKEIYVQEPKTPEKETAVEEPKTPEKEIADEEPKTPEKETAVKKPKTPEKEIAVEEPATPRPTIYSVPNTPGSLNMKRSYSKAFKSEEIKNKMSKGWLAHVVEDPNLAVVGYIQILGVKKLEIKEEMLTLIKASDGQYVTWNVAIDQRKVDEILEIPTMSIIKVKKASIEQGFRIIILEFEVIDDDLDEEITLDDELTFLEKSWYLGVFSKKGMMDKKGSRNLEHPHFKTTPLRMTTRSKTARLGSGGIPCGTCDKKFKSDKTMEQHRRRYH